MLWLYVPGRGWLLQPAAPSPSPGCVITPGTLRTPRAFGFSGTAATAAGAVLAALTLLWMCTAGHAIEVIAAVVAAALADLMREPLRAPAAG
ncbi:hypothetical protein [Streptomyces sp. NPDC091268]|uniref:hypothetical protein n=1 Tax=Streptomyces sp. NPDC091268 TaxID=3365979 RepID=UPI0038031F7E